MGSSSMQKFRPNIWQKTSEFNKTIIPPVALVR